MTSSTPLIVAQLTDTHLFADDDSQMLGCVTGRSLQAVLASVQTLDSRPHLFLLTGDLSQDETPESYRRLHMALEPFQLPTYWIPGNHDIPATMEMELGNAPLSKEKVFQAGGWQFILLNSAIPECVYGELSSNTLEWLDHQLQTQPALPTLIALHHPPEAIGSDWMDEISLQNPEAFYAVIDRHPQVKIVLFGHIHQEFETYRQSVQYLGSPSTCVQFKPKRRNMEMDEIQPGFRLLTLYPDGTHETRVERVRFNPVESD